MNRVEYNQDAAERVRVVDLQPGTFFQHEQGGDTYIKTDEFTFVNLQYGTQWEVEDQTAVAVLSPGESITITAGSS